MGVLVKVGSLISRILKGIIDRMIIVVFLKLDDLWFYDVIIYKKCFEDYNMFYKFKKLLLLFLMVVLFEGFVYIGIMFIKFFCEIWF